MKTQYSKDSDLFKLLTSPESHDKYNCSAVYTKGANNQYIIDEIYEIEGGKYKGYWRIDQDSDYCYLVEPYEVVETLWNKVEA